MTAPVRLGIYVRRLEQTLASAKSEALREFGLTVPQYTVLCVLAASANSGFSQAQLARVCLVTPQTMSTILGNLQVKGLISRSPSEHHAQVLLLTLTPAGRELFARADPAAFAVEQRITGEFSAEEQALFQQFLVRAIGSLLD